MSDIEHTTIPVSIEDEMRRSYMDYAMSVIIGRALPDVRDGLKPAHRRVIYGMRLMGLAIEPVVSQVREDRGRGDGELPSSRGRLDLRHARSDGSATSTCAITLVDGQGNFGSVDGDPPAAMRYTEAKLAGSRRSN